jgi:hypothetical protein
MDTNYLEKNRTRRSNPVARTLNQFNRPQTQRDRKSDYQRKPRGGWRFDRNYE